MSCIITTYFYNFVHRNVTRKKTNILPKMKFFTKILGQKISSQDVSFFK